MTESIFLPSQVIAGDSLSLADLSASKEGTSYSAADGWSLRYRLVGSAGVVTLSGAADGSNFDLSVGSAFTATWAAGDYEVTAYVTKDDERVTLYSAPLEVLPDPATSTATDRRTHAKKTLDAIEATIEGRASKDQESYTINGRSLARMSIEDLLKFRGYYQSLVKNEEALVAIEAGNASKRRILVAL